MPCNPQDLGADCINCPLAGLSPVTPPNIRHPVSKKLAVVVDGPTKDDVRDGRLGRGYQGHILRDRILKYEGVKMSQVHLTSAVLCHSPKPLSPPSWKKAVAACRPRLARELEVVKPTATIAFGPRALQALTGKVQHTKFLGSVLQGEDFYVGGRVRGTKVADFTQLEVVATEPPSKLFKDNWPLLPVVRSHVEKAWKKATGQLPEWDWGEFYLDPNKKMLGALRRLAEDPDPMSIDIETTGVDPWTIDITRIGFANSTLAISVPWCDWQGVNGVRPERTPLDAAIVEATKTALVGGQLKIFQNGIFDRTTFRVHGIECRGPYFDTLYAHQLYSPGTPHDLGFQAGQEFWVPAWKQEFKGFKKENEK